MSERRGIRNLNEEEDIRMEDIMEEHWKDISEDGDYKSNIHALMWDVYIIEKEYLIKRNVLVSVLHPKGGNIFVLEWRIISSRKMSTTKLLDYVI